ncbi:hypothetical protein, partial [Pseudomonas aeruginosa]|uniref:hypothetical protein n=1 Tax=Pseudomonas aeruginosa TaxID=287 RepID=UPI0039C35C76
GDVMEQNPNLIRRAERRAMLEAIVVHRYGIDVMDRITFRPLSSGRFFDLSIRDLLRLLSFSDLLKCLTHHVAKIDQFLLAELTSDKLVT